MEYYKYLYSLFRTQLQFFWCVSKFPRVPVQPHCEHCTATLAQRFRTIRNFGSSILALVERYDAVKFSVLQRNLSNFRWLVLFCIEADFGNQILIFLAFFEIYSRAYRLAFLCTAQTLKEHSYENQQTVCQIGH